jgi:hypothetical protein
MEEGLFIFHAPDLFSPQGYLTLSWAAIRAFTKKSHFFILSIWCPLFSTTTTTTEKDLAAISATYTQNNHFHLIYVVSFLVLFLLFCCSCQIV